LTKSLIHRILVITKDEDYLQSPDKQAKVCDLPVRLTVRVRNQTRFAQAGLKKQIDQLVYKLYSLTEEEIKITEISGK